MRSAAAAAHPPASSSSSSSLLSSRHLQAPLLSSNSRQSSSSRRLVAAAARRASTDGDSSGPADNLSSLKLAELRERCSELGLSTTGKKAELAARITDHLAAAAAGAGGAQQQQPPPAAGGDDEEVSYEELVAELASQLGGYSDAELASCCADRGLVSGGLSRQEQVWALARAIADDK